MEPGEQFSLCWNNFQTNLSTGFQSLYKDEDLVDVTLAAQGYYIKAHKTVLSVCSPFFKELFKSNPSKHPIVILPDINYVALRAVVQFMYKGEVSVSQEDIPTFMKVAEALKVKGLTDNNDTPNGLTNPPKTSPHTTPIYNFQKRPHPSPSPIKKIIRPPNPSLRNLASPRPTISPQPNHSTHTLNIDLTMPPPLKKPMVDPLPVTEIQNEQEQSFRDPLSESVTSSAHNTPSTSPALTHAVPLIKPKDEPLEDGENGSEAQEEITIEGSVLLDTQIAEGSRSGEPSPTHQMSTWPSSDSLAATTSPDDTSQPAGSPGSVVLVKSGKGQLVLIRDGHIYTFCDQRNNQSLWVCVKKNVLQCKGRLITVNSSELNTHLVLNCLAHNHPQMHEVIQRLYVPKREAATPLLGRVPSTSTSPALNLCNK